MGKSGQHGKESDAFWLAIAKNYELIQGAQLANSFICLLALSESDKPLSSTQISEYIARKTEGQILKVSGTIKDSLERRLKKAGYVKGVDIAIKKKNGRKAVRASLYEITPKGRELLDGWVAFLSACKQ